MKKYMRRSTKIRIIATVLVFIVLFAACGITTYVLIRNLRVEYDGKISDLNEEILSNKRNVLVTTKNIKPGDIINHDNTISKTIYSSFDANLYMSENDFGVVSLVDIPVDTAIQNNMITEHVVDQTLREEEFTSIYLNSNLRMNDVVDIRIVFPNGENYIVLSKKSIKNLSLSDLRCFLWIDEEETLLMSSAIVDAYLNKSALLYTAKYIEPNIQDKSIVTYTPSKEVIELIKRDPNIVSVASKYLSEKLRNEFDNRMNNFKNLNEYSDIVFKNYIGNTNSSESEADTNSESEQNNYQFVNPELENENTTDSNDYYDNVEVEENNMEDMYDD